METFYKAVRPDGTDFYSGTVDYAAHLGEWLPEREHVEGPECCSADVYHVSTSAADTLIGGSWPCRLFEVEAEAVCLEDNKRGVYTMRIVREIESWRALGPNGQAVALLLEKAKGITVEQAQALHAALHAAWYAARYAAWNAAGNAARDAARYAARYAAGNAAWNAAWDAAWDAARDAARDAAWDAARDAARDAAWYAAGALVVRDLITPEQFDALYRPWADVMGDEICLLCRKVGHVITEPCNP